MREQDEALAGAAAHVQGKSRRRRLAVPPAERERVGESLKPLEAQGERGQRSEGRRKRLAERARERLDERRLDLGARIADVAPWIVGNIDGYGLAENRADDQVVDALVERDQEPRLRLRARVHSRSQARAVSDRLKQRRCANLLDRAASKGAR